MNRWRIQFVLFGLIGLVVILAVLLILGVIPGFKPSQPPAFTLAVWGWRDDPKIWDDLAAAYKEVIPSAQISYRQIDPARYETELLNALAAGTGPDIFFLDDSAISKDSDKIQTLADGTLGYTKSGIQSSFADSVAAAIINNQGSLIGIPAGFDTLTLFYNRDYLNSQNISGPPQTWDDLSDNAQALSRRSDIGAILRSGVALGTAANVAHAEDVFTALLYQSGGQVLDPQSGRPVLEQGTATGTAVPPAAAVLSYLTSFSDSRKKTYTWGQFFENSLDAFADGSAAMAFGYAADVPKIKAKSPQLNFGIAPLPQPKDSNLTIGLGRFSMLAVSKQSQQQAQAWNFLLWFSGKDIQALYSQKTLLPPARRDLANVKPPQDYLLPFYNQILPARTIAIRGGEFAGQAIRDMIDQVSNRTLEISAALRRADEQIANSLNSSSL